MPAERTKMGRPHNVPLPPEAVALLESTPRLHGSDIVFPNSKGNPLSDAMLSKITHSMHNADVSAGGKGFIDSELDCVVVPHGFRSSFKDWARNNTTAADEVSELALAHVNSDATRAAYARDELLPQRTKMMAAWAEFCRYGEPDRANVTNIKEA